MISRRETGAKAIAWIAAFAAQARGQAKTEHAGIQTLTVPFEFAAGRGSLLIPARLDRRPTLLIVDTGSSHTVVRPAAVGIGPGELAAPRTGAGVIGDAVGRVVTLEIGDRVWQRRRVAVMDLSAALAVYEEKIDGLLGIDFLLEFSQAVIDMKRRVVSFVP
jgi:hypothetical protein